jgi:hypothetical protein
MYGMDNTTLYSNNPQINVDCSNIYIGEVLCVDTEAFSYPEYNATLYDVSPPLLPSSRPNANCDQSLSWSYLPYCDE